MTSSPAIMVAEARAGPGHDNVTSGRPTQVFRLCLRLASHSRSSGWAQPPASPPTSSLIGNPSAAAGAQAAFFLPVNKVFRSLSLQRPRFLSHYLPHRQPNLPQKQDFFFLFIFTVPLFMGYVFSWL